VIAAVPIVDFPAAAWRSALLVHFGFPSLSPWNGAYPMIDSITRNLSWLGHDAFRLVVDNTTLYFDPFQLKGAPPLADIILVSHEHRDHCSPEDVAKIQQPDTLIITERKAATKLSGHVICLAPGEHHTAGSIKIEAVPSYNTNKLFHPAANGWLGFIVTVNGITIYHAGDTDRIPEMKTFKADIALLPVSGTYVMTADEAAQAALDLNPALAIPMHYGSIVGDQSDAERFAGLLAGKIPVSLLPLQQ
jgi:L-ascorbate metabolism protein UlaG (beta-lactamase superfamily)